MTIPDQEQNFDPDPQSMILALRQRLALASQEVVDWMAAARSERARRLQIEQELMELRAAMQDEEGG